MEEMRNANKILSEDLKGRNRLKDAGAIGTILLKWMM
jgi:hypothetical protein